MSPKIRRDHSQARRLLMYCVEYYQTSKKRWKWKFSYNKTVLCRSEGDFVYRSKARQSYNRTVKAFCPGNEKGKGLKVIG